MDFVKKLRQIPAGKLPARARAWYRSRIRQYPATVILQTVTGCNLQCAHCFLNDFGAAVPDGKRRILSLEEALRLIDAAAPALREADAVQFSTFEALLHRDLFALMDRVLQINPRIRFPLLTNGMLLTGELLERLDRYPVNELTLSLDGTDRETVQNFKTGVDYDTVINAFALVRQSALGGRISSVFVLHRHNLAQLPAYLDMMCGMGVRTVYVNHLLPFTPAFRDWCLYNTDDADKVRRVFGATVSAAVRNGQTLWLPAVTPRPLGCTQCRDLLIGPDGDVAPCDFLAYRTPFAMGEKTRQGAPVIFGNVFKDGPLDIYRSRAFRRFRARHASGELPEPCTCCIDGYGLLCSRRLANDFRA